MLLLRHHYYLTCGLTLTLSRCNCPYTTLYTMQPAHYCQWFLTHPSDISFQSHFRPFYPRITPYLRYTTPITLRLPLHHYFMQSYAIEHAPSFSIISNSSFRPPFSLPISLLHSSHYSPCDVISLSSAVIAYPLRIASRTFLENQTRRIQNLNANNKLQETAKI